VLRVGFCPPSILILEENLYGNGLNGAKTLASSPGQRAYKRAYKRWLEIKDSPLAKALEE
jgi:hypothetical protein